MDRSNHARLALDHLMHKELLGTWGRGSSCGSISSPGYAKFYYPRSNLHPQDWGSELFEALKSAGGKAYSNYAVGEFLNGHWTRSIECNITCDPQVSQG